MALFREANTDCYPLGTFMPASGEWKAAHRVASANDHEPRANSGTEYEGLARRSIPVQFNAEAWVQRRRTQG